MPAASARAVAAAAVDIACLCGAAKGKRVTGGVVREGENLL